MIFFSPMGGRGRGGVLIPPIRGGGGGGGGGRGRGGVLILLRVGLEIQRCHCTGVI